MILRLGTNLFLIAFLFCTLEFFSLSAVRAEEFFDVVIRNGKIVDGTGNAWYYGDIGIRDGRIATIGKLIDAKATASVDAAGLVVAPGFIDMMGQTATPMLDRPETAINLLSQGITTINAGEGSSAAPLSKEIGATRGWTTMAEYFQLLEMKGIPVNVVQTIGHTQVRELVIGEVNRRPSDEELAAMKGLVREAMEAGAIGVSTALIYPPAIYAPTEEIAALVETAGEYNGRYYTHMRNEGDRLLEAIDEALEIGRKGNAPVHIFHLKAAGRQNWSKMDDAIQKIRDARAQGQQVTADVYPYINNGLDISSFIHPRHFEQGREAFFKRLNDELKSEIRKEMESTTGWENWYRHIGFDWTKVILGQASDIRYRDSVGKSVQEIAVERKEDVWETFFQLARTGAFVLPESMSEENKVAAMQEEFISYCTDVGPAGGDAIAGHPRAYGAFPRLFGKYVREMKAISLEKAVAQASAGGANAVMAYDRGRIAVGLAADIVVFDPANIRDLATFSKPHEISEGVKFVFVNGSLAFSEGKLQAVKSGRVLRGPGFKREAAPFSQRRNKEPTKFAPFDEMMRDFMEKHRIVGASLAVGKNGKVLYSNGYGYADLSEKRPVEANTLFRIASISKPITAVAILKLIDDGKLKLDDRVYDLLELQSCVKDSDKFDARWKEITIEHLLQHRGGWDRDKSFDAMFQSVKFAEKLGVPAPAQPDSIIRAMLEEKLDFTPGERFAYSNFGYCLLGRVIEKLTGLSYEDHVREGVLTSLEMQNTMLGKTLRDGRRPTEATYYHPDLTPSVFQANIGVRVPSPYGGWNLEAMDAHGGWLSTSEDLIRFCRVFDGKSEKQLLLAESLSRTTERPSGLAGTDESGAAKASYYGLGWFVRETDRGHNLWHTGSLPGTATILIHRWDGIEFAVLFNSRVSPHADHLAREIDPLLHQAANRIKDWPE